MSVETENPLAFDANEIREIPLEQIEPNKEQIRKEFNPDELAVLAESIKRQGLKVPIHVATGREGKYKIVDGERRWRALNMLAEKGEQIATIRAMYADGDSQLIGILGNIARSSYNPMETADALALVKKLLGESVKDDEVAKHVGRSRTIVVEYNSLLKLPKKIQEKARNDSCVPFNKLKSLAASKMGADEKVVVYDALHKKYSTGKTTDKPKDADGKQSQSRETRSVIAVRKKLDSMKSALDGVQLGEKVDDSEKENFLKSLQEIIETAQAVQQKLSS